MTPARPTSLQFAIVSALLLATLATCADVPRNDALDASDVGGQATADLGRFDASDFDATESDADAASDVSSAEMDAPTLDAETPAATWVRLHLDDGAEVTGELVATYDTTRWWDPGPGLLYAVFNPAHFGAYPNDRSFRFIESTRVESVEPREPEDPPVPYRDFLRAHDITFQRPPLEDTSWVLTAGESYHLEENGYGTFAWDFEQTDANGVRFTDDGSENGDYLVWDDTVYSGVSGEVIEIVDHGPDNMPGTHPERSEAVNNLVGIALGGHFYAYYLHFRENGVDARLEVGDVVRVGDPLGRVGNSGVTLEPHVHVVLLWWDELAQRSYSVPIEFEDVGVAPSPRGPFRQHEWWTPETGEWLRP